MRSPRIAFDVDREIAEATDLALVAAKPDPQSATLYVYSPNVDPAGASFDSEPSTSASRTRWSRQSTRR